MYFGSIGESIIQKYMDYVSKSPPQSLLDYVIDLFLDTVHAFHEKASTW
jgi:hypothetical protein